MIGIGTIFRHNTGSGGGGISTLMDNWIKEHIVFHYDVKKQGATNETLKESAYLQDLSGKGRRMKLNNFLFTEQSGVTKDHSLATDGVDDYGLVENLSSGVKMLFMTVNPIGDNVGKAYYAQKRTSCFWLFFQTRLLQLHSLRLHTNRGRRIHRARIN